MIIKPIKINLGERLKDRRFRERFISTIARDEIAGQIRELRQQRGLNTQARFAEEAGMQQSAVSRIESADYSGWTFKTLVKVAVALNARLRVNFEPLEKSVATAANSASAADLQESTIYDHSDIDADYVEDKTNNRIEYTEWELTGANP